MGRGGGGGAFCTESRRFKKLSEDTCMVNVGKAFEGFHHEAFMKACTELKANCLFAIFSLLPKVD